MSFSIEDRKIIREISQSIGRINDRLDIHAQLVEMNGVLKKILEAQSSQAEVDELSGRLDKQAAEFDAANKES